MLDIPRAASDAFARTKYLLWERRSFARWWRYALLCFLSGGNGGFSFKSPGGQGIDFKKKFGMVGLCLATASLGNLDSKLIPLFLGIFLAVMFLVIIFAWLSSCAQYVLLESIVYDRHVLGESFGRLKGKGTGLFFWSLLVGLGFGVPLLVVGGATATVTSMSDNPVLSVPVALAGMSIIGILIMTLCVLFSLTHHFVIPVAYRQRVGLNSAWSLVGQTLRARKMDACLFLLALVALGIVTFLGLAAGVLVVCGGALIAGCLLLAVPAIALYQAHLSAGLGFCGILLGLLLLGTFLVTLLCLQTPFTVFSRCFGVYVMQQLMPQFGLLPLGGRPEMVREEPVLSEEPQPMGALLEDSWESPEF
jgi:hypothetical protein